MKFHLAECKFVICKYSTVFCHIALELIYDTPARQNSNLFEGNGRNSGDESKNIIAEQDLMQKTVSAVLAQVSI